MLKKITNFSIHQTSKIVAAVYAAIGAIFMVLALLVLLAMGSYTITNLFQLILLGAIYIVLAFIFSYITTAIMLWIFNKLAKRIGGIEVHIED